MGCISKRSSGRIQHSRAHEDQRVDQGSRFALELDALICKTNYARHEDIGR